MGINGTERPGAVYLAACLAGHNQKGLPAFGIYGRDVQDKGDTSIPADVQEKLLRFAKAGLAVSTMRGKSYLSMGGVSMGIAGSIVDQPFFESYLACVSKASTCRNSHAALTKTSLTERVRESVCLDPQNCKEGKDINTSPRDAKGKDRDWQTVVKMAMICP